MAKVGTALGGGIGIGVLVGAYLSNQIMSKFPWWLLPPYKIDNELVSVIIPTYNEEKYIENTIISLMNQTCKNLEIIVVDAMSTDRTPEILARYARRIIVIKTDKLGIAYARNLGTEYTTGKYLLHLDADVLLENVAVEKMLTELSTKVCTHISVALYDGNFFEKAFWTFWRLSKPYWYTQRVIMVRRDIFFSIGGFDEKLDARLLEEKPPLEDKDFGLRISKEYPNRVSCLKSVKAATSARRIKRMGLLQRDSWQAYRDGSYQYIRK